MMHIRAVAGTVNETDSQPPCYLIDDSSLRERTLHYPVTSFVPPNYEFVPVFDEFVPKLPNPAESRHCNASAADCGRSSEALACQSPT